MSLTREEILRKYKINTDLKSNSSGDKESVSEANIPNARNSESSQPSIQMNSQMSNLNKGDTSASVGKSLCPVEVVIKYGIDNGCSDIHIGAESEPRLRINGELRKMPMSRVISTDEIETMIKKYHAEKYDELVEKRFLDTSFRFGGVRFRANYYYERKKITMALRLIPTKIPEMENLYLPEVVKDILKLKNGIVLVTGATGSGKSTTIASIINEFNKQKNEHILTIEDPIEFEYKEQNCLIHQRELGNDVMSFGDAIICALREDPDIILLGEIRNHESISAALTLAETGHLVFATLHTKSAAESIGRIIDVFPPEAQAQIRMQLAGSLRFVIAQRLLPNIRKDGRVPLIEVMVGNDGVRGAILNNEPISALNDQISLGHREYGSQTFKQSAESLLSKGLIARESVNDILGEVKEDVSVNRKRL